MMFVAEMVEGGVEKVVFRAAMFFVAGGTVCGIDTAVQPALLLALCGDGGVAAFAACGFDAGKCRVALGAVVGKGGMVGEAAALLLADGNGR